MHGALPSQVTSVGVFNVLGPEYSASSVAEEAGAPVYIGVQSSAAADAEMKSPGRLLVLILLVVLVAASLAAREFTEHL